jgi:prepilin-type N-terminal cleavage/methylation domain-containing protein
VEEVNNSARERTEHQRKEDGRMITRLSRAAKNRRRQKGGFTLIELLVVITILGILAAVVSVSLLGITSKARENAKKAELQTVQAAFDAMLADQQISSGVIVNPTPSAATATGPLVAACSTDRSGIAAAPTSDMTRFPPGGLDYVGPALAASEGPVTVLATHYLRQKNTAYKYSCDGFGNITQTGP